jgi:hypothetical protein
MNRPDSALSRRPRHPTFVALLFAAWLPIAVGCSSASSEGSGSACYTLQPTPATSDPAGADRCEFLITTSGAAECETMYGIAANHMGACPSAGLVGCCLADIGQEGAAPGTTAGDCYYDAAGAETGKAGCMGPHDHWQAGLP